MREISFSELHRTFCFRQGCWNHQDQKILSPNTPPSKQTSELPWSLSWKRIRLQCRRPHFDSWVGKVPWRRDRLPTPVFLGFPGGSDDKESASCNAEDLGSIPGLGRSPGEGHGNPLQYSCLENPMDKGAWWAIVHGVTKNWTWLTD